MGVEKRAGEVRALRARVPWTRSGLNRYKPTARGLPMLQPSTRPRKLQTSEAPPPGERRDQDSFPDTPPTPSLKSPRAVIAPKPQPRRIGLPNLARGGPLAARGRCPPAAGGAGCWISVAAEGPVGARASAPFQQALPPCSVSSSRGLTPSDSAHLQGHLALIWQDRVPGALVPPRVPRGPENRGPPHPST